MTFLQKFEAARRVSTPLVAVQTPDPAATIDKLRTFIGKDVVFCWDFVRGLYAFNEKDKKILTACCGEQVPEAYTNPAEALGVAMKFPQDAVFFYSNAHLFIEDDSNQAIIQGIWNLRDPYKTTGRMLVMLCSSIKVPAELQDVLVLDEPLPSSDELKKITEACYEAYKLPTPPEKEVDDIVEAVSGLSAFTAEQATMMALTKEGINLQDLWERKYVAIEQVNGLSVERETITFEDIGGIENAKKFFKGIFTGKRPPNIVVFIDEIEKHLAGSTGGDLSGTSQEMLGALLSFMEDKNSKGIIAIGPPGCAKSMIAKASANTFKKVSIRFDLSGMKGSLVGESGRNLRNALKVVDAVSNSKILFIATCNSIAQLAPELRRRFNRGTFFFDLPTAEEREKIWGLYRAKYQINLDFARPDDGGWTGAEIKQCCDLADDLRISLQEAASYIVPVSKSAAVAIERLRTEASGSYISASTPGVYIHKPFEAATELPKISIRRVTMPDKSNVN